MPTKVRQYCPAFNVDPSGYLLISHIVTGITVAVNSLASYCIIKKTPFQMKLYSYHLLAYQSISFLMDFVFSCLTIMVLFLPAPCGYPGGLLKYSPISTHHQFIFVIFVMYLVAGMTLELFIVRYQAALLPGHILKATPRQHFVFCLTGAILVFLLLMYFPVLKFETGHQEELAKQLTQDYTCYDQVVLLPRLQIYVSQDFSSFSVLILILLIGLAAAIALLIFLTFRSLRTFAMSASTVKMQKKFLKSLCLQTIVPITLAILPAIYLFYSIVNGTLISQTAMNSQMLLVSCHGGISSLVMLAATEPYRRFLISFFPKRPTKTKLIMDKSSQHSSIYLAKL